MNNILELYERAEPTAPAIGSIEGASLNYGNLVQYAKCCGESLARLNIGPSSRVALVLPNGPLMATTFACCVPWCSTAPLNPAYTAEEFEFYFKDLEADILIAQQEIASPALEVAKRLGIKIVEINPLGTNGGFTFGGVGPATALARDLDAIALILHTSGTTSRPKMVPLSQRNLLASARNIASTLQLTNEDRCLNVMPLFHIHGLMAPLFASLYAGGSVICSPGFDALKFYGWLDRAKPTWYSAVPTMHQAILARAKRNTESIAGNRLRFIRSSSASLPVSVLAGVEETFSTRVVEAYAMTEAAHQMCSNPLAPNERKPGSVGPAAGPDVRIAATDSWTFRESGHEGEVVIRGENVTSGYINNPTANEKDFNDGWFRTGDLGIMDEEGYVRITGRLKEIINRGGEKIAPLEVDEVLLAHEAIGQVCTFAMPHEKLGEEVAAIVVVEEGKDLTKEELSNYARERLAPFKVPRHVYFFDEVPKGPTGKVQRIGMAERLGLVD